MQVLDDGAIRFVQPNGESFDSVSRNHTRQIGDWQKLPIVHERGGIRINAKTAATHWDRGPMDYGIAMDVLKCLRRNVSAETSASGGIRHNSTGSLPSEQRLLVAL